MKHVISFVILMILFSGTALGEQTDTQKMSEDVQTMARLIGGEIRKEFPGNAVFGIGMGDQLCNGVYLKDYGVVFMTSVRFPIFDYDDVTDEKETEKDNLWDKYKNDTEPEKWDITDKTDSAKKMLQRVTRIKELEKFLTDIICTYAGNLKMLSQNEYITIAVRGDKGYEIPFITWADKDGNEKRKKEIEASAQVQTQIYYNGKNVSISKSYGESDQQLIARIKKKDLSGNCADKIEISFY